MEIREMQIEEVEQVGKLHNDLAYYIQSKTKDQYFDFDILDEIDICYHIKSFINHPSRKIYIAKENGNTIGFIAAEVINCYLPISSTKKVGYISGAYILPLFRGQGIMKNLEKQVIEYFKTNELNFVEVNFISENLVAKQTWEGLGYTTFREQARKKI